MKYDELIMLVKGMKSIWTKDDFIPDEYAVRMWYKLLQDIPYEQCNIAIQKLALTSKWPPTVAEVREAAVDIQAEQTDWSDGWNEVLKAIGRFGMYREEEALASMSGMTREAVRRLGWKQLCQSEMDELTAIRANFRMIFEQKSTKEKEQAMLPDYLKAAIDRIGSNEVKQIEEAKNMRALLKNPRDERFHPIVVPNDLNTLQELVGGGYIETVTVATDACIICNEEGRIKGLEPNCEYLGINFVGPILIVGFDEEGNFTDCPWSVTMANGGIEG